MPTQIVSIISKSDVYAVPTGAFPLTILVRTTNGPKEYRLNLHMADDGQIRSMTLT